MMDKIKFFKILTITSIIICALAFFTYVIPQAFPFGGCYTRTQVSNINIPQNLNVEINPGRCEPYFTIINHGDNLQLYAISGNATSYANNELVYKEGMFCIMDVYTIKDLKNIENYSKCDSINLSKEESYDVRGVQNSWEIITNKGSITGFTKYSIPFETQEKITLTISEIFGIIFLVSLFLWIFLKKKINHSPI